MCKIHRWFKSVLRVDNERAVTGTAGTDWSKVGLLVAISNCSAVITQIHTRQVQNDVQRPVPAVSQYIVVDFEESVYVD